MGHKSKFTFPLPGRSAKQYAPALTISTPLSKAEKILGTGDMNIDSPGSTRDAARSWETGSTGGISISVSESTTSQSTNDTGLGRWDEDEYGTTGTSYGRTLWEQESEIIPRRLQSAHGPGGRKLTTKRSAVTIGADYRGDAMTDDSFPGRRRSGSSVSTHYEPAKVPLAVSQQTSNSAMAKGLPAKASTLLDMDGALAAASQKKKKPAKLDFSMLRPKSRKDRTANAPGVGPVLGNNFVTKSPSLISQSVMSPVAPSPSSPDGGQKTAVRITKSEPQATHEMPVRQGRPRGTNDVSGLHQLYDHYEQMSFAQSGSMDGRKGEHSGSQPSLPSTYKHTSQDVIMPLPKSTIGEPNAKWKHARQTSQNSQTTAFRAETPSTLHTRPASRNDYAMSVSSRHTRTSRASPSTKSTLDYDRQQSSVLSLSDSDSDSDGLLDSLPSSSVPSRDPSFRDDLSVSSDPRQPGSSRSSIANSHGTNHPKAAPFAQLNDYLAIPEASPKTQSSRSPSNSTLRSSNSTSTTVTPNSTSLSSFQDSRASVLTTETFDSMISSTPKQSGYGVQEAKAVTFTPLASTVEAASSISAAPKSNNLDKMSSQRATNGVSRSSHASDQPTPPLSPSSVEFYMRSPESVRRDSVASNATEAQNARMMAVTQQEEMLLAALRKKRARMRENIIAEMEEEGRSSRSSRSSGGSGNDNIEKFNKIAVTNADSTARLDAREAGARAKSKNYPRRSSSLMGRSHRAETRPGRSRDRLNTDAPPSTSHSDPTERASTMARGSVGSGFQPSGESRHERVLLYLDRPVDGIDSIDTAEPSPDLSEFLDSELEFPIPDRLGTSRPGHGSTYDGTHASLNDGKRGNEGPRLGSSSVGPQSRSARGQLQDVPEVELEPNEDIDADEIDFGDFDEVDTRGKAAPHLLEEPGIARPDSPISPADGLFSPSKPGHIKSKNSAVRLSAVGFNSPMPWWGDDD
ncbi:hypothetical protein F4779DRAFT_233721 [Xylariaceae sp. FL0662B]|nr:hypothetical protein F4779DRAFT_233721 [Xylariaceae sp. FL0662B]